MPLVCHPAAAATARRRGRAALTRGSTEAPPAAPAATTTTTGHGPATSAAPTRSRAPASPRSAAARAAPPALTSKYGTPDERAPSPVPRVWPAGSRCLTLRRLRHEERQTTRHTARTWLRHRARPATPTLGAARGHRPGAVRSLSPTHPTLHTVGPWPQRRAHRLVRTRARRLQPQRRRQGGLPWVTVFSVSPPRRTRG